MPLSEVYAAVEPFAYSLLSGSENRLFLLYLNDAEAFSQRYADKLLYMEKDVPRTVRTNRRRLGRGFAPPVGGAVCAGRRSVYPLGTGRAGRLRRA